MNIPLNTVFNPTVNGPLHLGHVYLIKVNEAEAHSGSGKFTVRFDDTQAYWLDRLSWQDVDTFKRIAVDDLLWLGISVDRYCSQSEMHIEAAKRLAARCHEAGIAVPVDNYGESAFPSVRWNTVQPYPFSPFKTAEKVIMDDMNDVSLKIRGEDLYGEYSAYCLYRHLFRMFQPVQEFVARLQFSKNGDTGDVSKTAANLKVIDLRAQGARPGEIMEALAMACLKNPGLPWRLDNLLPYPVLNLVERNGNQTTETAA